MCLILADTVLQVAGFQYVVRPHLLWKPDRWSKSVKGERVGKCVEVGPSGEGGDGGCDSVELGLWEDGGSRL